MIVQGVLSHEVLVTLVAVVVFNSRMGDQVTFQGGVVRKSFLTDLADERVGNLVDWHVFLEVDGGGKRTLAQVTLKSFIAVESLHVFDEIVSEGESLVAVVTLPLVL